MKMRNTGQTVEGSALAWSPNRRRLLFLTGYQRLGSLLSARTARHRAPLPAMSVMEALEACGTVAESFVWAFEINACLGFPQVMLVTGHAAGPGAGAAAARQAMGKVRQELPVAPGVALVVRCRPDLLTHREAFQARREVAAVAHMAAYVLYALCPDEEMAAGEIAVSVVLALDTS